MIIVSVLTTVDEHGHSKRSGGPIRRGSFAGLVLIEQMISLMPRRISPFGCVGSCAQKDGRLFGDCGHHGSAEGLTAVPKTGCFLYACKLCLRSLPPSDFHSWQSSRPLKYNFFRFVSEPSKYGDSPERPKATAAPRQSTTRIRERSSWPLLPFRKPSRRFPSGRCWHWARADWRSAGNVS